MHLFAHLAPHALMSVCDANHWLRWAAKFGINTPQAFMWRVVGPAFIALTLMWWFYRRFIRTPDVWLVDLATFKPPTKFTGDVPMFEARLREYKEQFGFPYTDDSIDFMVKLVRMNGLGPTSSCAPGHFERPPQTSLPWARVEFEMVAFTMLDELFAKTHIKPQDVDVLIVNCSLFNPVPSLAAIIMNKYKMRADVESYNLGGMGCSAGLVSVHLAKQLLQCPSAKRARGGGRRAVLVSTETLTMNWYRGNEKAFLVTNTLFRMGGSAALLSSRPSDGCKAKYALEHTVRTTIAADDEAFNCVRLDLDEENITGVRLEKSLMKVAARAMTQNIATLGPLILPYREQLRYVYHAMLKPRVQRWWNKNAEASASKPKGIETVPVEITDAKNKGSSRKATAKAADDSKHHPQQARQRNPTGAAPGHEEKADASASATAATARSNKPKPFVPNFKTAVDHICIHAGGRAVIDAIQDALALSDYDAQPSRDVLFHHGNVSSASVWYEMDLIERERAKPGHRVWQLGFGSGFKCNSAVWRKLR